MKIAVTIDDLAEKVESHLYHIVILTITEHATDGRKFVCLLITKVELCQCLLEAFRKMSDSLLPLKLSSFSKIQVGIEGTKI
jgi:hypothetical protein